MVALPSQPTKCQKISSASSFRRECFIRTSPWNGDNENDPRPEFLWRYFSSFLRHDTQKGEKNIRIVEWIYIRETRRVQHNTLSAHYLMCDGAFKISPVCTQSHTYYVCICTVGGRVSSGVNLCRWVQEPVYYYNNNNNNNAETRKSRAEWWRWWWPVEPQLSKDRRTKQLFGGAVKENIHQCAFCPLLMSNRERKTCRVHWRRGERERERRRRWTGTFKHTVQSGTLSNDKARNSKSLDTAQLLPIQRTLYSLAETKYCENRLFPPTDRCDAKPDQ